MQEAISRWGHRRADYPDLTLHLIGPLQTNKVAEAVALFDVIEVVDREKLVAALAKEMAKQGSSSALFGAGQYWRRRTKSGISHRKPLHLFAIASRITG